MSTTKRNKQKNIIAILPAYNAASTVQSVLRDLPKGVFSHIIVSDDCSKDDTWTIIHELRGIHAIQTPKNAGYGGNLKYCIDAALALGADIIIEIHPDAEYEVDGIMPALAQIEKGSHFVLGNRFKGNLIGMFGWKYIGSRMLTWVDNIVLGTHLGDLHQGFRVYTRELLLSVPFRSYATDYLFSFQIIVDAIRLGFTVTEVPVSATYTGAKRGTFPKAAMVYTLKTFGVLVSRNKKLSTASHSNACEICMTKTLYESIHAVNGAIWQCYICGTGYTYPKQIQLAPWYAPAYYGERTAVSTLKHWIYQLFQIRRATWVKAYVPEGSQILDVGSGEGQFSKDLGDTYTTVNLESPFAHTQNVQVQKIDMTAYNTKKPKDAITFWESLEHLDNPKSYIEKANTLLKQGGYLFVEYPRFDSWEAQLFKKNWYHLDLPRHRTHFTDVGIRLLLESEGFATVYTRAICSPEYAVVGLAASILNTSPELLLNKISNPVFLLVLIPTLCVSLLLEGILCLINQSPIGVICVRKK